MNQEKNKKKGFFSSFLNDQSAIQEQERQIMIGTKQTDYNDNRIQTGQYQVYNFIPRNLYEQFSKLPNVYFLIIGVLQMVNEISNSEGKPVIYAPLSVIILLTALQDLFQDYQRHQSDERENNRSTQVFDQTHFQKGLWRDLCPGDIIRVQNNQAIPADVVVLQTSDSQGICYVETKSLDGETNLKRKNAHQDLLNIYLHEKDVMEINQQNEILVFNLQIYNKTASVYYEAPHATIYSFKGYLEIQDKHELKTISLEHNNFLLRGCSIRQTQYIYALVTYTGHDTKIMLNSIKARPKMSSVEIQMNREIFFIFILQIAICTVASIWALVWHENKFQYLKEMKFQTVDESENPIFHFFVRYGTWMLLFTNFVPISLLVTLDFVQFLQGIIISQDQQMIGVNGINAVVQTSSLNEELGHVGTVFTDQTGTLTCNKLVVKAFSAGVNSYGSSFHNSGYEDLESGGKDVSKRVEELNTDIFNDIRVSQIIKEGPQNAFYQEVKNFFLHLAICHSIVVEETNEKRNYYGCSPDEQALLYFARDQGFELLGENSDGYIEILEKNIYKVHQFKVLYIIDFTSARKRMSVLIQDENVNKIFLLTKGADEVILQRLSENDDRKKVNQAISFISQFADSGLRTLLFAQREVPEYEFLSWEKDYLSALASISKREMLVQQAESRIQQNLFLVGSTGIEDKLQENVKQTINSLQKAGINVWMLTGDKQETAINVGILSGLIQSSFQMISIDIEEDDLGQQLYDTINKKYLKMKEFKTSNKQTYFVISGQLFEQINNSNHYKINKIKEEIYQITRNCDAVIAYRVSPRQKRDLVHFVQVEDPQIITLSIGDGANDVNMIIEAHIGIGINGLEGQQAVRASDYSIQEFQFLSRLLLYHGRENYRKNTSMILYNFYKNLILVLPQFWYGLYNGFSGQFLYDTWIFQLFNIVFASLPIGVFAIIDKEHKAKVLISTPQLYKSQVNRNLFSTQRYWLWVLNGATHAAVLCLVPIYCLEPTFSQHGPDFFLFLTGNIIFLAVVAQANLQIVTISTTFTVYSIAFMVLSALSAFVITYLVGLLYSQDVYNLIPRYEK